MKKKIIFIVAFCMIMIAAILLIFIPKGGNVRHVRTSFTTTDFHSEEDIKETMNMAIEKFKNDFKGCTLTDLWYDHNFSNKMEDSWIEQYSGEEAIILLSNFKVDGSGGDGSLNPNDTYSNWQWIFVKNSSGEWELRTWGY